MASAGQGFRRQGFGGLGIDGLAKGAGVTSGAFYAHFKSKTEAFRAVVAAGMASLADGVERKRAEGGAWIARFVDFYLTDRRECDLGEACALQSLTGDVARADEETRAAYERELRRAIDTLASGMPAGAAEQGRADAIALLALVSGGVSMARAVQDPALSDEIVRAVRDIADRIAPSA